MEGWLLCLSMKDAIAFGPYVSDKTILDSLFQDTLNFWNGLQTVRNNPNSLNDLSYAQGYHPLCKFCPVNSDCPKFKIGAIQMQWEVSISKLEELKQQRSQLDENIKDYESALKTAYTLSGTMDWISTESYRFRLSQVKGRRTLDRELLRKQLNELFDNMGIEGISVDDFLLSCEKESSPSSRLMIQSIN